MEHNIDYNSIEPLVTDALNDLQAFFAEAEPLSICRRWIESNVLRVYVRKCPRIIQGQRLTCLDIATIEVEEQYWQKGVFKTFVLNAHGLNPYDATCIEHAQNPYIEKWCLDNNWLYLPNTFPPSFYLLK